MHACTALTYSRQNCRRLPPSDCTKEADIWFAASCDAWLLVLGQVCVCVCVSFGVPLAPKLASTTPPNNPQQKPMCASHAGNITTKESAGLASGGSASGGHTSVVLMQLLVQLSKLYPSYRSSLSSEE